MRAGEVGIGVKIPDPSARPSDGKRALGTSFWYGRSPIEGFRGLVLAQHHYILLDDLTRPLDTTHRIGIHRFSCIDYRWQESNMANDNVLLKAMPTRMLSLPMRQSG